MEEPVRWCWKLALLIAIFPLALSACGDGQEPANRQTYVVGIVSPLPILDPFFEAIVAEMEAQGYVEGQNLRYVGYPQAPQELTELLTVPAELADQDLDLIITAGTEMALMMKAATTDIPVVAFGLQDPVAAGLVDDLTQPGGNITGVEMGKVNAKRLEFLREAVPDLERIYVPYNPEDFQARRSADEVVDAAAALDVDVVLREITQLADVERAINELPPDADAIFVVEDYLVLSDPRWSQIAQQRRIPLTVPGASPHAEYKPFKVFLGFGIETESSARQLVRMADQILRGTRADVLPIETAETNLYFNLVVAEQLGITVPSHLLDGASFVLYSEEAE